MVHSLSRLPSQQENGQLATTIFFNHTCDYT